MEEANKLSWIQQNIGKRLHSINRPSTNGEGLFSGKINFTLLQTHNF